MGQVYYTLQDVQDFLKEQYNLNWNGMIRQDFDKDDFEKASIEDFTDDSHYVPEFLLEKNGKKYQVCIAIGNWRFVIFHPITGEKYDNSYNWESFVFIRHIKSKYIKEKEYNLSHTLDLIEKYFNHLEKNGGAQWIGNTIYDPELKKYRKLSMGDLLKEDPINFLFNKNGKTILKQINIAKVLDSESFDYFNSEYRSKSV